MGKWLEHKKQKISPSFIPLENIESRVTSNAAQSERQNMSPRNRQFQEDSGAVHRQIHIWSEGLGSLNLPKYLSVYSPTRFKFSEGGYEDWKKLKKREFSNIQKIDLAVSNIRIRSVNGRMESQFLQELEVNGKKKRYRKIQYWTKQNDVWMIISEKIVASQKELGSS